MMAADWVGAKEESLDRSLFASRKKLKGGAWDYLKENVDYPYYLLRLAWKRPEAIHWPRSKTGGWKILKLKGKKMAVYRDRAGKVQKRSAICTHMGCVVRWNPGRNHLGLSLSRFSLSTPTEALFPAQPRPPSPHERAEC